MYENDNEPYPTNPIEEITYLADLDLALRVRPASGPVEV